jgi:hypothetical protein
MAGLHHAAGFDDDDAIEALRLGDLVGHAEQRRSRPRPASLREKPAALAARQPSERLVQDDESRMRPRERSAEPDTLALSSRDQRASLAEAGLKAVRESAQ